MSRLSPEPAAAAFGSVGAVAPAADRHHGLTLTAGLACIMLIALNLRPAIVSMGPLLPAIRQEFHLSHTQASLLTTIPDLLMGALALPTPWLARRFGRDRVVLAALVLLLLATGGRILSGSVAALLFSTVGIGAGIAIAGALIGGFIKQVFPDRTAFVMGLFAAALALGATLAAGISGPLSDLTGSWRGGAGFWALLGIPAIAAWVHVEKRLSRNQSDVVREPRRHALPFTNPKAWAIALFSAANNFLYYGIVSWVSPLYREHGMGVMTAGFILASFTGTFIIANPIAGIFSRRPDRRALLAGFSAIAVVGLVVLAVAPNLAPFVVMPVISFGLGGGFVLSMTLPLDNARDVDEANAWSAFAMTVAYLIAATGPLLVGALRDSTGGFGASLWLLVAVAIAMLALTPGLHPRQDRPTAI